jgi:hypothetical protein
MKKLKIDWPLVTEIVGIGLVGYGLYLVLPAFSFIAVGAFLIWVTEKE